ncbi:hypothetical protein EJB05_46925, partial [Eragrostis curvula]
MPQYSHQVTTSSLLKFLLALRIVAGSRAPAQSASGDTVVYSFAGLDDRTGDDDLVVTTTSSILSPASFLFDAQLFPEFNRSEGFVLLSQPIQLWGAAAVDTGRLREASFNTSFTVHGGATPVAFVVLLDSFPPLAASSSNNGSTFAGAAAALINASSADGLAVVEVGSVGSYGPESPDVGLNVTVAPPNGTAAPTMSRTVWIQYNAVTHHIRVYVAAAAGEPRPLEALVDAPLNLTGRRTTQSAFVGFFASTVREVVHGVRKWELTVDGFPGTDGDEDTARVSISTWLLILLAVLGSVAVTIGVASVVVCCYLSRRRQKLKMEHIMKQVYPQPTTRREGFCT